ncbi:MAG: valine--tRNA ligase [Clostridiales bacterium]|nr:valine--tRNA ligase [Clostridiales bacterium]
MKKELEKTYNPNIESKIYKNWLEKKYFHADADESRQPYTIMMPPANITGVLHVGHSLTFTIQDSLIRFKRMQGYNTLWMPGTDHASISTEVKIVDALNAEGINKRDIGREKFLERAWAWKEKYGGTIVSQLKLMGVSCDWDRERFTMDDGLSNAVLTTFIHLYKKNYIYRGEKLINWCPYCRTTISDSEVEYEEKDGYLYYFKYPIEGGGYIEFATTRPETILGDTAVAVNPDDERYANLIGKLAIIPVIGRKIPIIADSYVDKEFGSGAVKITPAHDPNDYEVGERHKLERISVMTDDGRMNENAGKYQNQTSKDCRKNVIRDFDELGLYIKKESIKHNVGTHERCHTIIEPLIKLQWFVKMADLAKPALEVYNSGKLRIFPARFGKVYAHWLENIRDWCVSRQLWWGHRIPAYYCKSCGEVFVGLEAPDVCDKCGHTEFRQEEDTLDTWFSSALWPFSTLGWPEKTKELEYFYPTSVLVTGHEILFPWVIRMVFSGLELMGDTPFKDVMLNGIVRDDQGRKMSKSLNNGVDPIQVIEQYGADALRLMLVTGNALDNDTRFYWSRLENARNFLNKLWNATRFVMMNMDSETNCANSSDFSDSSKGAVTDKWILSRANTIGREVTNRMDNYDLGMAAQMAYDFIWDEFCDWYIEIVKPRLYNKEDPTRLSALWTLKKVLIIGLKLLHPFVPFITEEIFTTIQDSEETIMFSNWIEFDPSLQYPEEEKLAGLFQQAIKGIRAARLEMSVDPSKKINAKLVSDDERIRGFFESIRKSFVMMAGASTFEIFVLSARKSGDIVNENDVPVIIDGATVYISLDETVDREKELERLNREKKKIESELSRCEVKLNNPGFLSKAPEKLVSEEREKLRKYNYMLTKINDRIAAATV